MSKGIVTVPITIAPISFATCAIIGVAPVAVPPPNPPHTNTMSAALRVSFNSVILSFAASLATLGNPPAPSPLVKSLPIRIFLSAS